MDKKAGIIRTIVVSVVAVVLVAVVGVLIWQVNSSGSGEVDYGQFQLPPIRELSRKIDYNALDLSTILPASDATGGLEENVIGSRDAPVVINEYADYPCSYCALMNPYINQIVEDYGGKVAVTVRTYILPYHIKNGVPAAAAANAAAIQGYWKKYKDLLFTNQSDWFYAEGDELIAQLEQYFLDVSDNQGDLDKFRADMRSENVAKKIAFDYGAGVKVGLTGTPSLYIDGEWISNEGGEDGKGLTPQEMNDRIRQVIDEKLGEK